MKSPEEHENIDSLRQRVVAKTQAILGDPIEHHSVLFDGEGWVHDVALAVRGVTYERSGSFVLGEGYQQVTAIEGSVRRFGRLKTNYLAIHGEPLAYSEGPSIGHWHYDLHGQQTYSAEEYSLLDQLLSTEGEARDQIYNQLVEIQKRSKTYE